MNSCYFTWQWGKTQIILLIIENNTPCKYGSLSAYSVSQSGYISDVPSITKAMSCSWSWLICWSLIYVPQLSHAHIHAQIKVKILLLTCFKYYDFHVSSLNDLQILCVDQSNRYHLLLFHNLMEEGNLLNGYVNFKLI